jgi:hypothetical protein
MMHYAGADWVRRSLKVENMSPLGERVADLLGALFLGIYHLDEKWLNRVDWSDDYVIKINIYGSLSTIDGDQLTRLVVHAHDAMLRVSIRAATVNYLELMFHQRKVRDGSISDRCPTIEKAVADCWRPFNGQQQPAEGMAK